MIICRTADNIKWEEVKQNMKMEYGAKRSKVKESRKNQGKINKLIEYSKNPLKIINYFGSRGHLKFIPDPWYLKIIYRARLGKKLNLLNPQTYTEKIQWLKLYDRKAGYSKLVDKYEVRKFIAKTIGEQYLIPLIGVYQTFDEIDFNQLPHQFVLKCTHDSGSVVICKDKSKFDRKAAEKKLNGQMKKNYYYPSREWPYRHIKPRIICEAYLDDGENEVPKDYKIFCFHGEPKFIFLLHDRFHKELPRSGTVYTTDWEIEPCVFDSHYMRNTNKEEKPKCLAKMLELCRILSKGFPQVRIDFYTIEDKCYFGEMTLTHSGGFCQIKPEAYDELLGSFLRLPGRPG